MGRNRKAYRDNKKQKRILEKEQNGSLGITNLYGKVDLTPYNATRLINKKASEVDIRY